MQAKGKVVGRAVKLATNRTLPTTVLACTAAISFALMTASCASSEGFAPDSATANIAVVTSNGSTKLVEGSGLSGTWLVDRIEVDGTSFDLDLRQLALTVGETETTARFSFLLFNGSAECSIEGGEWFRNAKELFLQKLYLQNAVECNLARPSWVSLIRPALTSGSLKWDTQQGHGSLSSELVRIQLTRKN